MVFKGCQAYSFPYIYHLEEAAIGGHHRARYHLGREDSKNGRNDRAVKHFVIVAKQGDEGLFGFLKFAFKDGLISKEDRFYLSIMYSKGYVKKDKAKEVYHLEQAAVGGHPSARYNLGKFEWVHGDRQRAMKHYMIAASLGCNDRIKWLVQAFKMEKISKDDLTAALRAHQTAVAATKSPQRKEAEEAKKRCGGSFDAYGKGVGSKTH